MGSEQPNIKDCEGKEDVNDDSTPPKHSKENSKGIQSRTSERSSEMRLGNGCPADFCGLQNQGEMCYLNSVLQILYMTPEFKEEVSSAQNPAVLDQLQKLFGRLESKAESSFSTEGISNSLKISNVYKQGDAVEYFQKILNAVGTDVSKVYRGTKVYTTTCLDHSGDISSLQENFITIPISIEGQFNVRKGLMEFSEPIQLDGKYCSTCQKKTETEIKCTINGFPTILTLHLKRFGLNDDLNYNCKVEIPTSVDVQDNKYSLYGILNHFGSIRGGHYTAWLKSAEKGKWYDFDDSHVRVMESPEHESISSDSACLLMYKREKEDTTSNTSPHSSASVSTLPSCPDAQYEPAGAADAFCLASDMIEGIPVQDKRWIANTLFHSGELRQDLKLWYEPPVPSLNYHPTPDSFFTHRLMVWMPYHLWKVRVSCPDCRKPLTGSGVYKRAWKVLDIDRYYLMVTETLRCTVCTRNYLSTSQTVQNQLDLPYQKEFRLILTQKYACDIRVIRLLRDQTLCNSPARLVKQLKENHGKAWQTRLAHDFVEPPEPIDIPTSRWLLSVYGRDILSRMDNIKASITSTFGSILKMDSPKKITKKLAGHGRGLCVISIGNEIGQILTSVVTVQEGPRLDRMVSDVMKRYHQAGVPPPVLLYVNRGCCASERTSKLPKRFAKWPDHIRLDIGHFMRRLAAGCTTNTHPLYPTFMDCLSACIFEWDAGDIALLRQMKMEQLRQEGVPDLTDDLVNKRISKKELSQYCRRWTRGVEATITLIEQLLKELGESNLMGLDQVRMEQIWREQKRHVGCIQDVQGVQLYTVVGTTKGGVTLTRYRCARGSTSLESFHCHLNRFIPGSSANTLNFQLYLLEVLNRWNQDRGTVAVTSKPSSLHPYSGDKAHRVNPKSRKVFGWASVPSFEQPDKNTGELLGVDYMLSKTEQLLKVNPDSKETESLLEDVDEGEEEDECFEEAHDVTVSSLLDEPNFSVSTRPKYLSSFSQPAAFSQPASTMLKPGVPASPYGAVDDSGVPGMDRVDRLAEYLVELRNESHLTNQQVSKIVALWQDLLDYDKFHVRHQFRSPNKRAQEFTPDCCRLIEAIFVRLCAIYCSTKKRETGTVPRWDLILKDYRRIRQCILANVSVMKHLQQVDVSDTTLMQWYNKRVKRQNTTLV